MIFLNQFSDVQGQSLQGYSNVFRGEEIPFLYIIMVRIRETSSLKAGVWGRSTQEKFSYFSLEKSYFILGFFFWKKKKWLNNTPPFKGHRGCYLTRHCSHKSIDSFALISVHVKLYRFESNVVIHMKESIWIQSIFYPVTYVSRRILYQPSRKNPPHRAFPSRFTFSSKGGIRFSIFVKKVYQKHSYSKGVIFIWISWVARETVMEFEVWKELRFTGPTTWPKAWPSCYILDSLGQISN